MQRSASPCQAADKGIERYLNFVYEGTLSGREESPVEGLKFAAIGDPITYLLSAGRWFPMVGYLTDRFTAEIHVTIPSGYKVIGSGLTGSPRSVSGGEQYSFNWTKPSFPGTIIAGKFNDPIAVAGSPNVKVYLTDAHKQSGTEYAQTAVKEFDFFSETFGDAASRLLNVVELPDDTLPAYGLRKSPRLPALASPTAATFACWPIPWLTSGGGHGHP